MLFLERDPAIRGDQRGVVGQRAIGAPAGQGPAEQPHVMGLGGPAHYGQHRIMLGATGVDFRGQIGQGRGDRVHAGVFGQHQQVHSTAGGFGDASVECGFPRR
jgi:hypothetical protein